MGPTVWELEGPIPILKSSKRLVYHRRTISRSAAPERKDIVGAKMLLCIWGEDAKGVSLLYLQADAFCFARLCLAYRLRIFPLMTRLPLIRLRWDKRGPVLADEHTRRWHSHRSTGIPTSVPPASPMRYEPAVATTVPLESTKAPLGITRKSPAGALGGWGTGLSW